MVNQPNPYITGAPLTSANMFYGRDEIFQFIRETLLSSSQNLMVLYGQRRIGKTSILNQLPKKLPSEKYHIVNYSLFGKAQYPKSYFLYLMAKTIAETIPQLNTPAEDSFRQNENYFHEEFLTQLFQHLYGKRLIILFDEYDEFGNEPIQSKHSASQTLLPYFQQCLSQEKRMTLIFAIGHRLEALPPHHQGFFKTALVKVVPRLSPDESRQLVTKPTEGLYQYDPSALKLIWKLTAGHPYFTQLIASEIFNLVQRQHLSTVMADHVHSILPTAMESGAAALAWFWDGLSRSERIVFSAVAHAANEDGIASLKDVRQALKKYRVNLLETEIINAPKRLAELGMLELVDQKTYHFIVEFMRGWVFYTYPLEDIHRNIDRENSRANRYFENAREAHLDGELDMAIEDYQRSLKENSDHLGARLGLAQALYQLENYADAITEYKHAYQIDPEAAQEGLIIAQLKYANQMEASQKQEQAIHLYRNILDIADNEPRAINRLSAIWIGQARTHLLNNQFDTAMGEVKRVFEIDPKNTVAHQLVEEIQAQKKQYKIKQLVNQLDAHRAKKDWQTLKNIYQELIFLEENNPVWHESLNEVEREIRLETLFNEAKEAHNDADWGRAETLWASLYREQAMYVSRDDRDAALYFAEAMMARRGSDIQSIKTEIEDLKTQNQHITNERDQLSQENQELREKVGELDELNLELSRLQAEITNLTTERDNAQTEKQQALQNLDNIQSDHRQLIAETDHLKSENQELKQKADQIDELNIEVTRLQSQITSLTTERAAALSDQQNLQQTIENLQQENDQLKTGNGQLEGNLKNAFQQQKELKATIEQLEQQIASQKKSDEDVVALQTQNADLQDKIQQLETELETKAGENAQLQQTVQQLESDTTEKTTEIDQLQGQLQELKEKQDEDRSTQIILNQKTTEIDRLKTEREDEKKQLTEEISALKDALQEKTLESSRLQKQVDELTAQVDTFMQVPIDESPSSEIEPPTLPVVDEIDMTDQPLMEEESFGGDVDVGITSDSSFEEQDLTSGFDFGTPEESFPTEESAEATAEFEEQEISEFDFISDTNQQSPPVEEEIDPFASDAFDEALNDVQPPSEFDLDVETSPEQSPELDDFDFVAEASPEQSPELDDFDFVAEAASEQSSEVDDFDFVAEAASEQSSEVDDFDFMSDDFEVPDISNDSISTDDIDFDLEEPSPDLSTDNEQTPPGAADIEEMDFMSVDELFDHVSEFTDGLMTYNETRDFGVFERIYEGMDQLEMLAQAGEFTSIYELAGMTKTVLYRLHLGEIQLDENVLDVLHDAAEALTNLISGLTGEENIDDESLMTAIRERFRDISGLYDEGDGDFEDMVVG